MSWQHIGSSKRKLCTPWRCLAVTARHMLSAACASVCPCVMSVYCSEKPKRILLMFDVRVTTEDGYFVLDGCPDPPTESETCAGLLFTGIFSGTACPEDWIATSLTSIITTWIRVKCEHCFAPRSATHSTCWALVPSRAIDMRRGQPIPCRDSVSCDVIHGRHVLSFGWLGWQPLADICYVRRRNISNA